MTRHDKTNSRHLTIFLSFPLLSLFLVTHMVTRRRSHQNSKRYYVKSTFNFSFWSGKFAIKKPQELARYRRLVLSRIFFRLFSIKGRKALMSETSISVGMSMEMRLRPCVRRPLTAFRLCAFEIQRSMNSERETKCMKSGRSTRDWEN